MVTWHILYVINRNQVLLGELCGNDLFSFKKWIKTPPNNMYIALLIVYSKFKYIMIVIKLQLNIIQLNGNYLCR